MSESSQASSPSSFFNLHVEGVGYLNRVRTVKPKKGQEFLACTVAALRGSDSDVCYTKFDCRQSVRQLHCLEQDSVITCTRRCAGPCELQAEPFVQPRGQTNVMDPLPASATTGKQYKRCHPSVCAAQH